MTVTSRFLVEWRAVAGAVDLTADQTEAIGADLVRRHTEPHRHYHTEAHIEAVIDHLRALDAATPTAVVAAFFHDAIYDPTARDNEARSAALVAELLAATNAAGLVADVAAIVRATATHALPDSAPADTAAFLDADLAILAAPGAIYDRYVQDVRAEYAHLDDETFATGRRAVLASFVERDQLYFTPTGRNRFEAPARTNLHRELSTLR